MAELFDTTLLHAVRLDMLGKGTAREMRKRIEALLADLDAILDTNGTGPLQRPILVQLVSHLNSSDLSASFVSQIADLLETVSTTGTTALVQGLEAQGLAPGNVRAAQQAAPGFFKSGGGGDVPYNGRRWSDWSVKAGQDTLQGFGQAVASFRAADTGTIRDELRRSAKLATRATQTLAQTAVTKANNASKLAALAVLKPPAITHWVFTAVLDNRTSVQCQTLDSTTWEVGDPAIESPPLHPSCRSVLVPLTRAEKTAAEILRADQAVGRLPGSDLTRKQLAQAMNDVVDGKAAPLRFKSAVVDLAVAAGKKGADVDTLLKLAQQGAVSVPSRYELWLGSQSAKVQLEVLGPTKLRAWNNGLPLNAMGTAERGLTVKEIKSIYPSFTVG